jgi:hypothetical protein
MNSNLNVFLLIGQSNMAGRGRLDEVPSLQHAEVSMFLDGRWIPAEEPLHTDKPDFAGIGLGMSFAVELATRAAIAPIGLIPCAFGGTSLAEWMPGTELYENAVSLPLYGCVGADGSILAFAECGPPRLAWRGPACPAFRGGPAPRKNGACRENDEPERRAILKPPRYLASPRMPLSTLSWRTRSKTLNCVRLHPRASGGT